MMYEFNEEEIKELMGVLTWQIECEENTDNIAKMQSILDSISKQGEDNKSLDKIRSYKPMRRLEDTMWEVLTDDQEDIEKYLPAGKTVDYVIIVTDKEGGDSDEEDLTDETWDEITDAVTHAMWDMFGHQPDDDVVVDIVSSVRDKRLADPEADIEDLVDQEMSARYLD